MKITSDLLSPPIADYWRGELATNSVDDVCAAIDEVVAPRLQDGSLLGAGSEAVVFKDGDLVKKFLMSWPQTRAPIDTAFELLSEISRRIPEGAAHFYPFVVERIDKRILEVRYQFEPSSEIKMSELSSKWHSVWRDRLVDVLQEAMSLRIAILDPEIKNFLLVGEQLKLIDYGRDISTMEAGMVEMMRLFFMLKNDIYELGPSYPDYFR